MTVHNYTVDVVGYSRVLYDVVDMETGCPHKDGASEQGLMFNWLCPAHTCLPAKLSHSPTTDTINQSTAFPGQPLSQPLILLMVDVLVLATTAPQCRHSLVVHYASICQIMSFFSANLFPFVVVCS